MLSGYFTVEPNLHKGRSSYCGLTKSVHDIPDMYLPKFKSGKVLKRACEAYGDYLKEEANNQDDEYEGEEE